MPKFDSKVNIHHWAIGTAQGWKVSFPWEVKTWHKLIHRTVIGIGKESLHSEMIFNVFPLILSDYIPTDI